MGNQSQGDPSGVSLQSRLDLACLVDEIRHEAAGTALLNLALLEYTDPPHLKSLPLDGWPPHLASNIGEGLPCALDKPFVLHSRSFRALYFGAKESTERFGALVSQLAELLRATCPRDLLPPWLAPCDRWVNLLLHAAQAQAHRLKARGGICWRNGEGGSLVVDIDLQRLGRNSVFSHGNPASRLLRGMALQQGMRPGTTAVEVWFHTMRDLWGASLEVIDKILPTNPMSPDHPNARAIFGTSGLADVQETTPIPTVAPGQAEIMPSAASVRADRPESDGQKREPMPTVAHPVRVEEVSKAVVDTLIGAFAKRPGKADGLVIPPRPSTADPYWDSDTRKLYLGDKLIKQFKGHPAKNQVDLLEAFEREKWSPSIPDPFRNREKLAQTIHALNRSEVGKAILFEGDGTGDGVNWKLVEKAT
jgi:hypothetical protein